MALYTEILKEIQDRTIPAQFKSADLRKKPTTDGMYQVGEKTYKRSTLDTMLANLAIDANGKPAGKHVQNGQKEQFIRVAPGVYSVICSPEQLHAPAVDDEIPYQDNEESEPIHFEFAPIIGAKSIAEFIADYLQQSPFQYFFKKQNKKHPVKPANGLKQRLNAYFWPDLSVSWESTQQELHQYVAEFKTIEQNKEHPNSANKLLELFSKICKWGGVKLPDIAAIDLKQQVFSVLHALDSGNIPSSNFRINSAYTKLYAIARPDTFIIFDSRVAAALTSIIDSAYQTFVSSPDWSKYKGLGFVNGRGGSRPRPLHNVWPNGYQKWSAQIAANQLCQDIVSHINKNPLSYGFDTTITLRELEAILFMEGY